MLERGGQGYIFSTKLELHWLGVVGMSREVAGEKGEMEGLLLVVHDMVALGEVRGWIG